MRKSPTNERRLNDYKFTGASMVENKSVVKACKNCFVCGKTTAKAFRPRLYVFLTTPQYVPIPLRDSKYSHDERYVCDDCHLTIAPSVGKINSAAYEFLGTKHSWRTYAKGKNWKKQYFLEEW